MAKDDNLSKGNGAKERGVGFPYLSLPEAVKIIRDAGSYGKQHARSALASYAGHTTANSGPFKQKLAALKDWGFVTTSGDTVKLTETAMSIAYPSAPDEAVNVLMAAFRGCGIFWKIYQDSAKGIPLKPELIANGAVTAHRIGVSAKDKFIKSFVESAEAVGLAQRLPSGEIKMLAAAENVSPKDTDTKTGDDLNERHANSTTTGKSVPPAPTSPNLQLVVSQGWRDQRAGVVFEVRSSGPLSAASFTEIGSTVTAIEKLWKVLNTVDSTEGTDDGGQDDASKID